MIIQKDYLYKVNIECIGEEEKYEIVHVTEVKIDHEVYIKAKTIQFLYEISDSNKNLFKDWVISMHQDKVDDYWEEFGNKDTHPEYFI